MDSSVTITPSGRDLIIGSAHHANTLLVERADLDELIAGLQRAVEKPPAFKPTFLNVQFGHKSPLLEALELIGPAYDDGSFSVRYGIASMIVQPILRSYENRAIRCDPTTGRADVREIDEILAQALAGTEFTAKVTQPGSAHRLGVSLTPNRFDTYKHDCDRCTPLGSWSDGQRICDLYYCDKFKLMPTVIARHGSDGPEYTSGLGTQVPVLLEAERLARERGLL